MTESITMSRSCSSALWSPVGSLCDVSAPDSDREPPQTPAMDSENSKLPEVKAKALMSWMSSGAAFQRSSNSTVRSAVTSESRRWPTNEPCSTMASPSGGGVGCTSVELPGSGGCWLSPPGPGPSSDAVDPGPPVAPHAATSRDHGAECDERLGIASGLLRVPLTIVV